MNIADIAARMRRVQELSQYIESELAVINQFVEDTATKHSVAFRRIDEGSRANVEFDDPSGQFIILDAALDAKTAKVEAHRDFYGINVTFTLNDGAKLILRNIRGVVTHKTVHDAAFHVGASGAFASVFREHLLHRSE